MITIRNNVNWYEWQSDVIRGVFKSGPGSIHVVKSSRQCGKSVMCESIILKYAVDKPCISMYLSPTIKQARKVFKEIVSAISQSSVFRKSNESFLEIYLANGSTIAFCSAEQGENLRGYTVSGVLIVDEAAYIDDEVFNAVLPTTDVHQAPIIIVSTPRFRSGFFYNYYMDGLDRKVRGVYGYDWAVYDKSKILSPERLEFYRKRMPRTKFVQDYLGEFCDLGFGVFGEFEQCLWKPDNPSTEGCSIGVDWSTGVGSDETAIAVFNSNKEMIDLVHFNDLDDIQTINEILQLVAKYHPTKIIAELNSIGRVFFNILQRRLAETGYSGSLRGFNTTNASKQKIVNKLQVAIQNQECKILKDEQLINQMGQFESKLTGAGKVTYAASKSNHDDLVMAMLLGFEGLSTGSYCIA